MKTTRNPLLARHNQVGEPEAIACEVLTYYIEEVPPEIAAESRPSIFTIFKEVIHCLIPVPQPARTGQAIAISPPGSSGISGAGQSLESANGRTAAAGNLSRPLSFGAVAVIPAKAGVATGDGG